MSGILNEEDYTFMKGLNEEYNYLLEILNKNGCPNLTVCPKCHVDDFCHVEGCSLDN
ncbi:hypothetical protein KAR91_47810 [Candidatus Pacearchaeota archaeon]|nr:hypothetical protein [Candidatus Pacearchaeota archaeon]